MLRKMLAIGLTAFVAVLGCSDDDLTPGELGFPVIRIVPPTATVAAGSSVDFDAIINGVEDDAVEWSLLDDETPGAVNAEGVYTAPDTVSPSTTVVVVASVSTPRAEDALAEVTIVPAAGSTDGP